MRRLVVMSALCTLALLTLCAGNASAAECLAGETAQIVRNTLPDGGTMRFVVEVTDEAFMDGADSASVIYIDPPLDPSNAVVCPMVSDGQTVKCTVVVPAGYAVLLLCQGSEGTCKHVVRSSQRVEAEPVVLPEEQPAQEEQPEGEW